MGVGIIWNWMNASWSGCLSQIKPIIHLHRILVRVLSLTIHACTQNASATIPETYVALSVVSAFAKAFTRIPIEKEVMHEYQRNFLHVCHGTCGPVHIIGNIISAPERFLHRS